MRAERSSDVTNAISDARGTATMASWPCGCLVKILSSPVSWCPYLFRYLYPRTWICTGINSTSLSTWALNLSPPSKLGVTNERCGRPCCLLRRSIII